MAYESWFDKVIFIIFFLFMLILIPVDKKGQKSEIHLTIKTSNNGIYLQQISLTIRFVVSTVIKRMASFTLTGMYT